VSQLIPEQRADYTGKIVTRHVRSNAAPTPARGIPAPSIAAPAQSPGFPSKARTQQIEREVRMYNRSSDSRLKSICSRINTGLYGAARFTASDVEIYDVLSTCHGNDAILLLAAGMRTRQDALEFLKEHDLELLIIDHEQITQDALQRDIPALHAMELMGFHGSRHRAEPHYLDALEANGIRTLRELEKYYPTIPNLIMSDVIRLSDIKTIGVTRLLEGSRRSPVVDQLKKIRSGESSYDAETMKQLLVKAGKWRIEDTNVIKMANSFGAENVLNLIDLGQAAEASVKMFFNSHYSDEQRGEIIAFYDRLAHHVRHFEKQDVFSFYDHGVTVEEVRDGLEQELSPIEIVALKNGVRPNLADGWL
jgi:hypothetical protein